ncbi:T9SS type A sorting domain-containing protein [Hymenobacter terricola]|uniref:T9SS type A sorting domain-containing protein n=1 Tax=Hymenobacter terricola TaxID=2819236 RepID=UPI001B31179B|nr:T9SS type A sorting domain-containing protein [Hymenobacter terricola]
MNNNLRSALLLLGGLGLAQVATAQTTPIYKFWSLKAGAQDSAALRSPSTMAASSVSLNGFVLSNGTAAAPPKPYSSLYGMAFAPSAAGGNWGTSAGGTGSTLRRYYYVQFTATAPANTPLRADSLVMNLTFLSTTTGTNLGVRYSKSGFVSDSVEASGGGKGPTAPLVGAANGSTIASAYVVAPSITLVSGAPNNLRYSVALNGASGVSLTAGQTLTVRVYVSSSTSSAARHALLRNVALKSQQVLLATRPAVQTNLAAYPNPVQNRLTVPHTAASRDARVTVFSNTGTKVAVFATQPGTTETAVDLSTLTTGLYLVEYADGTQRSSARIAKE